MSPTFLGLPETAANRNQADKSEEAIKAIDYDDLRDRVVSWKNLFFCDPSANYAQAKPGTFRLVPKAERLPELRRDYQLMRDMYLNEPVTFDDILSTLTKLEHRINLIEPLPSLGEALIKKRVHKICILRIVVSKSLSFTLIPRMWTMPDDFINLIAVTHF